MSEIGRAGLPSTMIFSNGCVSDTANRFGLLHCTDRSLVLSSKVLAIKMVRAADDLKCVVSEQLW